MISLKGRYCLPGHRTENSVNRPGVITVALQSRLHVHDYLIGREVIVAIDGAVIRIVSSRSVTPGRIPVTSVPIPPAATDKDDPIVMASPPAAIVPLSVIITKRGVRTAAEAGALPVVGNPRISRHVLLTDHRQISSAIKRDVSLTIDRRISLTGNCGTAFTIETRCAIYAEVSFAINRNLVPGPDATRSNVRHASLTNRRTRPRMKLRGRNAASRSHRCGASYRRAARPCVLNARCAARLCLTLSTSGALNLLAPRRKRQRERSNTYTY